MFNKKVLFIICLFLMIITTSTAFASDDLSTNDVAVVDNNVKTFDDVQSLLASPNAHNEVFLGNTTYVANSDKPINITSNLLIYGSRHVVDTSYSTIDAKGLTNVFNIVGNCTVRLSNINIINSKSTISGAVSIGAGATVTIYNVNFINNTGAITVNSKATVFCEKDNFINNSAANGGAISGAGNINVNNSYFYNNVALLNGGAIYGTSNINVVNSRFNSNKANNGGAIGGYENVKIIDSTFTENIATTGGGAIFVVKALAVDGSNFINNKAGFGGAIAVETDISAGAIQKATITNSIFKNNNATNGPGASIYVTGDLIISDSAFESLNSIGGTTIFVPTEGTITSNNNLFACNLKDTNLKSNLVLTTDKPVSNTVKVYIYVPFYSEGNIIVSLNRIDVATINNTLDKACYAIDVTGLVAGDNNISVRYVGDNKFVAARDTIVVNTNTKQDINIDVTTSDITYKEDAIINITSSINGPVEVRVGSILQTVTIKDNKASISVPNLDVGNYLVEVTYKGDATYGAKTASTILTVYKANSTLSVTNSLLGDSATITIASNMPGDFIVLLNGKPYTTVYSNYGYASFTIDGLERTNYKVTVISNNTNYEPAEASTSFSIDEGYLLTPVNSEVYFSLTTAIQATAYQIFASNYQKSLNNVEIIFTIDGKNYTVMTEKGNAYLYVNLTAGVYPFTVRFADPEKYSSMVKSATLIIKPLIIAQDMVVNSNEEFNYSAQLIDDHGNPIAGKEMAFTVSGIIKKAQTDSQGKASVTFSNLPAGKQQIIISANGFAIEHFITVLPANMSALVVTATTNSNKATVTATLSEAVVGGIIVFDVNGVKYNVTISGKVAILPLENLANNVYKVNATLKCNAFAEISNKTSFRINIPRDELFIESSPVEIFFKQNANISVYIHNELDAPLPNFVVVVSINGKDYTGTTDANGKVNFIVSNLKAGVHTAYINCQGDNVYYPKTMESSVKVSPINMTSMVLSSSVDYNDIVVTATFSENVKDATVIFKVNNVEYVEKVQGNKAVLKATLPKKGTYTVTATLNCPDYNPISNTTKLQVKSIRGEVILTAKDLTMYYMDGSQLIIKLTDDTGAPLDGVIVKIKINGEWYERTTKDGGIARMTIKLSPDVYKVVVNYPGNATYYAKSIEVKVTVKTTILESDFTKVFRNSSQFLATFLTSKGTPLVGATAKFNINGIFYDRTTNATGGTKFTINLGPGVYILTAQNPSNGEMRSVNVTILANMVAHNVTKYYQNGTQYEVQLLDNHGNPAPIGSKVTLNINGVFYERSTKDSSAIAKLTINLAPGRYVLTAIYNDLMLSSVINVKSTIESKNLDMSVSSRKPFVVKVLDKQGKPAAKGSKLSFNINGVIYNRTINNDDATASLNINLQAGTYIITTMYDGLMQSNTVTITSN